MEDILSEIEGTGFAFGKAGAFLSKAVARKALLRVLNSKDESDRQKRSNLAKETLLKSSVYEQAERILCFWSINQELDTHALIVRALQDGKEVYLPICKANRKLEFRALDSSKTKDPDTVAEELTKTEFGLYEPKESKRIYNPLVNLEEDRNTLCICPGLLFDKYGYRLGYGGGYYDRFLATFKGQSIAYSTDYVLVDDLAQLGLLDTYDVALSYLMSDSELISARKK